MAAKKSNLAIAAGRNRQSINIVSFLVTCLFLFVAVKVSDGGFANSISKITENLDRALLDLNDNVNYTDYNGTEEYVSSTQFCSKGMAGYYNLTNLFLDFILPKDILLKDLLIIEEKSVRWGNLSATEILKAYWGLLLMVLILLLLVIFLPVCGLCFCCCRCCGNCGARSQPADKKRDLCKKIIQGTFLIILGTALLFCVVCAFESNQQLQDGIGNFAGNMKNSVKDTKTYLNGTKNEVTHLLVTNYKEFADVFSITMNKSSDIVMQELENYSKATAMMQLANFVEKIPQINNSFFILKEDTNKLRVYASQLNDAMRKVKKDLLKTLENCAAQHISDCNDIKNNISRLETNIDFNKLPDVSSEINKLNDLPLDKIQAAASEGTEQLSKIKTTIEEKLSSTLLQAGVQVQDAGNVIKNNLNNVTQAIDKIQESVDKYSEPVITNADLYISDYGQYFYYGGLTVSCVLLLVTICIALGLICGICGKRPDGYSDNCCNKGAGGQFLICAVMIIFIFGFIMAVITLAMFLLGASFQRVICYPIKNPDNSTIFDVINKNIDLNMNITISQMLINCYQNKSAYETFNLRSQFDIAQIQKQFDIDEYLDELQLDNVIPDDFQILSTTNRENLEKLKDFDPSDNLYQFQDELKGDFTNFSLDKLSNELQNLIDKINARENSESLDVIVSDLQLSVLHLNTYNEKLLIPMKDMANTVIDLALELDKDIKMNYSSFGEAIDGLIQEIDEAQDSLVNEGSEHLTEIAQKFKVTVKNQVNSYLFRVGNLTENEIGQCGPLSLAINGTVTSTCDKVLLPWNGFWFSLFWSLILFIPTLVISVKLATLYQKYKQYGQYVETEYLYDAYADRGDSIPLNSRGDKRSKKKNKKSKRGDDRPPNIGGEIVTREYATGLHPPDTRYADMAPKHWEEFPNGGPPQYQRAPTEYERPPPYYYPGTATEP